MARAAAFAPVVDGRTRVLILGSLPGAMSLAQGQYYANPRNGFWQLAGGAIGTELVPLPYAARLAALRAAGVGLWDVIATAERRGSLDSMIRDPDQADLRGLVASLPALRAVAFNGGTSARIGRRQLAGTADLALIDLPSSSPAYAGMPLAEKLARWSGLSRYLGPTEA